MALAFALNAIGAGICVSRGDYGWATYLALTALWCAMRHASRESDKEFAK